MVVADVIAAFRNPDISFSDADITQIEGLLAARRRLSQSMKASTFAPGDRVTFSPRNGAGLVIGTVLKINPTTISVMAVNQVRWKVSPNYLTKVGGPMEVASTEINA